MRGRRRQTARGAAALVLVLGITGCAPALPDSVIPGTKVVVGWAEQLTSVNAAALPTAGNIDIAAMTRGDFGDVVDGEFVADESFGTVTIVSEDPFTVRYDLAEPSWSDDIPLDAADLLLGWAGAVGYFPAESDAADAELGNAADSGDEADAETIVPTVDEFARSIDVTMQQPVREWQSTVSVPVAAHLVGAKALGIDDPMVAKQAVITAIQTRDDEALQKIGEVWNTGFSLGEGAEISEELLLSSGPFQVSAVNADSGVTLVPNPSFSGAATPMVARIDLVPPGDDPIAAVGTEIDIAQVAPTAANQQPVHELERKDFIVNTTYDNSVWAVLLNPTGIFTGAKARTAFFHAIPPNALTDGAAGEWRAAYSASTSVTTQAESRAYSIVSEDSGFMQTLGSTEGEPPLERQAAGVAAGSPVCVLYDRSSEFAAGAFDAMKTAAAEAGWRIVDCGADDYDAALKKHGWDAVIARVPIPQSPAQLAAAWGTNGANSITGHSDPARDELIAQYAQTADVYEARDIMAQIEATIVRAAVALPFASDPVVTVVDRDLAGVSPRNGTVAPLMSSATQWAVVQ
ncbi:ABC transporter substrate-binding protein [Microbacterium sp.]|uniref:ABC transporter substrate-binding protein n=1 Tax=Microbacterium sp. TaxID=51671 RepID=UPI00261E1F03|nr:ABC transporter substrate-binding protein [Microbacterium sp.]